MNDNKTKKTVRWQIMTGFLSIIIIPIVIILTTVFYLTVINRNISIFGQYREQQVLTKNAIIGHYEWITNLGDSIIGGLEFKGSLDPNTCSLGKWIHNISEKDASDTVIASAIKRLNTPHQEIHLTAKSVLDLSKSDYDEAYEHYLNEIKPKISTIIGEITVITNRYNELSEQYANILKRDMIVLILVSVSLLIIGITVAICIGVVISKNISVPIKQVAEWAKIISKGESIIDFSTIDCDKLSKDNEVHIMVRAFRKMVQSISDNVEVVKRVAAGDLTAYVNIRSAEDSLGKSIYQMVQSNDAMFADILDISSNIALNANQISQTSDTLSISSSEQAASVQELMATFTTVNKLTKQNTTKVGDVLSTFNKIRDDITESKSKMEELVEAVEEIRISSNNISTVIKTIEDISFQTNILALNASIEAARAGLAGKGFAVVAEEVRDLSLKSKEASERTKVLIENSISKTTYGNSIAKDTNQRFNDIATKINTTAAYVESIAVASKQQLDVIQQVDQSIKSVTNSATNNAASSEEAAAASSEMHIYADMLKAAMSKFNLRQRKMGKPYIPEEKKNDAEFIRQANMNYERAVKEGRVNSHEN